MASVKLTTYSYRFAIEVLSSKAFEKEMNEIVDVLSKSKVPLLNPPKTRTRKQKKTGRVQTFTFVTSQKKLNDLFDEEFEKRGWECQPPVTQDKVTGIKADYEKSRIQVEVQFGNMARWYTDVFKFQVSYSLGLIDVGVLVVPMQAFANTIDENVAHYERVIRELPYAKMSITLPIWVVGIAP